MRLYRGARQRSLHDGVEFSITEDDIRAVFPADWRCPVLGIAMQYGKLRLHDASPTLDRINPAWGYVPGNIAVISYRANRAKGAMTAAELEQIADWMRGKGLA